MIFAIIALYAGFRRWNLWISAIIFAVGVPAQAFVLGTLGLGASSEILMRIMFTAEFAQRVVVNFILLLVTYAIGYGISVAVEALRSRRAKKALST